MMVSSYLGYDGLQGVKLVTWGMIGSPGIYFTWRRIGLVYFVLTSLQSSFLLP